MSGVDGWAGPPSIDIDGELEDSFVESFLRSIEEAGEQRFADGYRESLDLDPQESPTLAFQIGDDYLLIPTGRQATVGSIREFVSDASPSVGLAWGLGGGETLLIVGTIWTLISTGLTIQGIFQIARGGQAAVDRAIYEKTRHAFEDWRDGGALRMPLESAVKELSDWTPPEIDRRLGATPGEASKLFQALGYVARRDSDGQRHWIDPAVPWTPSRF